MPDALAKACFCGALNCEKHKRAARRETQRQFDQNRSDDPCRAIYRTKKWQRTRAFVITRDVLCKIRKVCVEQYGVPMPSTEADHVIPIRQGGDPWDPNNLQGACHACHAQKTAAETLQFRKDLHNNGTQNISNIT
jgi:5-methylcytosine-specific restriction protein A